MPEIVLGGLATYGQLAGILMLDSTIPRIPGDPGHAGTFPFPVRYAILHDYPFQELVDGSRKYLHLIISAVKKLEDEGVSFIAADCGLFSVFQPDIASSLKIPFLGSSLSLIPLISGFLPKRDKIGIITGDTRLLKAHHLKGAGADEVERLLICGMEKSPEFQKVVLNRGNTLDVDQMRAGVVEAAEGLLKFGKPLGAVILECSNLASFRKDVQKRLRAPVFDIVSLIEFFMQGYRLRDFEYPYLKKPMGGSF